MHKHRKGMSLPLDVTLHSFILLPPPLQEFNRSDSLQCFFPAEYHRIRAACLTIQNRYRGWKLRLQFIRKRRAIIIIQSNVRGMFAREVRMLCAILFRSYAAISFNHTIHDLWLSICHSCPVSLSNGFKPTLRSIAIGPAYMKFLCIDMHRIRIFKKLQKNVTLVHYCNPPSSALLHLKYNVN